MLQLTLYNPLDDHYGQSPLEACAYAVDVHNAGSAWNKALLDNSARPSGALVHFAGPAGERLTPEQFDRLKEELASAHTGAAAAGRPLLLEGGLDWKPMMLTPAEMDFAELKHSAAREIALAFGVPPQLLGIPGDATYSNYKEANAAFWRSHPPRRWPPARRVRWRAGWPRGSRRSPAGCASPPTSTPCPPSPTTAPPCGRGWTRPASSPPRSGGAWPGWARPPEGDAPVRGGRGVSEASVNITAPAPAPALALRPADLARRARWAWSMQTGGALLWAGGAAERIASLERRLDRQAGTNERLARLEAQTDASRAARSPASRPCSTPVRRAEAVSARTPTDGTPIEGYASLWWRRDLGDDVVAPGAFDTAADHAARPREDAAPARRQDARGRVGRGAARRARPLRARPHPRRLARRAHVRGAGARRRAGRALHRLPHRQGAGRSSAARVRVLTAVDLWEVSLVTFPMLREARLSLLPNPTRTSP